jgi:hypothetical protein
VDIGVEENEQFLVEIVRGLSFHWSDPREAGERP